MAEYAELGKTRTIVPGIMFVLRLAVCPDLKTYKPFGGNVYVSKKCI